ncbi:hypothetical protein Hoch_1670 [Haliangium ochraceum DSM 14365]|uniref:Cytochrome c domain-containing protein n=1 Tax=Haliangium ochraceum (strain DSM 14365 / JCM 11303 / SMP-2) TaxID=502025 RepID=D0LWX3_HALO1|nr:hypothetical protein Hoch_1670 [Haliangium ochraceum DSM 14365]
MIFREVAGCAECHDPDDARHPFSDGGNHGTGFDWALRFINAYDNDGRLRARLPDGVPGAMRDAATSAGSEVEVAPYHERLSYLQPLCIYDGDSDPCLAARSPMAAASGSQEESQRLARLIALYLGNPALAFIPGQVEGEFSVNTPSLRALWSLVSLTREGDARAPEAVFLPPGHSALGAGVVGRGVDRLGTFDVHGSTQFLAASQVADLLLYLRAIE